MAKNNRSDYMRWARRRASDYLVEQLRASADLLARRVKGEKVTIPTKVIAAIRVLHERGVYSAQTPTNPSPKENQS